jgi:hypothetical protein
MQERCPSECSGDLPETQPVIGNACSSVRFKARKPDGSSSSDFSFMYCMQQQAAVAACLGDKLFQHKYAPSQ